MKNYFGKILDNCDEVTRHSLMKEADPLSWNKRLAYHVHLMFCKCCSNFVKQTERIDNAAQAMFEEMDEAPPLSLPEDFKEELKKKCIDL